MKTNNIWRRSYDALCVLGGGGDENCNSFKNVLAFHILI